MMKNFYKSYLLLSLLFVASLAYGQRTVTGKVTDAKSGEGLIGVNVIVLGSSYGTATDIDGNFNINLVDGQEQLEFSYIGYQTKTIEVTGDVVDITMDEGSVLDEVVVIGYGTAQKREATGAIESIDSKDFNGGVISSPEQLIQGRAAGVQITSSSGEPGAGINLRIRGASSVRNGNNPLYVIDGVPLIDGGITSGIQAGGQDSGFGSSSPRNPLTFINPSDIQNIDILKDASATAIYGSRGANGVVLITTKSGQFDQGLSYRYSLGISNITKKYDLLSADEFKAAGGFDWESETDWQDEILRTAFSHNHNISFGAGDASKGNYRISVGIADVNGIVENTAMDRISANFSGKKTFFDDRFDVSANVIVANVQDQFSPITDNSGFEGDLLAAALKSNPTLPIMEGDSIIQLSNTEPSPAAILAYVDDNQSQLNFLGSLIGELKITDDLLFTNLVSQNYIQSHRSAAYSRDLLATSISGLGRLFNADATGSSKLWESYLTYDTEFGDIGLNALVGYSYQDFDIASQAYEFSQFQTSDLTTMVNNFASAGETVGINSTRSIDELQSQLARVKFDWLSKLFVSASIRRDGSTKFGPGNQYGIFPAFGLKYDLTKDGFLPDVVNDLGIRVGWGRTGNSSIPHNLFQTRTRYNDRDINNDGDAGGTSIGNVAFSNPDLKWESTDQINVGLDFAFADYKVAGSINWYNKTTNDLLIQTVAAQPAASPFVWENIDADVINTGIELDLKLYPVSTKDFTWGVLGNVSFNNNVVKNLNGKVYDTGRINGQGLTGAFAQRIAEDQPLYAFFLRDFGGFDAEGNSIYNGGDFQQFVDAQPIPKVVAGITNTFDVGPLNFSFFFSGQFGHHVYSNTSNAFFTQGSLANNRNVTQDVVGNGEGGLNAPDVSTRFLEKADFVRLQNASLGYSLPIASNNYLQDIRLFVQGANLLTFTNYSGQDPEVDTNKSIDGIPSLGIDYTPYPRARTIVIGGQIKFK